MTAGHSFAGSPDSTLAPDTTVADLAKSYIRDNPEAALETLIESMGEWSRDFRSRAHHEGRAHKTRMREAARQFRERLDEQLGALHGHISDLETRMGEMSLTGLGHHETHHEDLLEQIDRRLDPLHDRLSALESYLEEMRLLLEDARSHHEEEHHDHYNSLEHHEAQDGVVMEPDLSGENIPDDGEGWFNPADEILEYAQLPVYGQDDARFSLVFFYHYDCEACRVGDEMLREIVDQYPDFRIVYRDLSTPDDIEARLPMATWQVAPDRFHEVHARFLGEEEVPSPEETMEFLTDLLGAEAAEQVWQLAFPGEGADDSVGDVITANRHLGEAIDFDLIPRIYLNSAFSFYETLPDAEALRQDIEDFLAENA